MEILLALLAGAGLVGFILFGRPKSADQDQAIRPAPDRVEQVQPKPEPIAPTKVESTTPPFPIVEIPDPWSDAPPVGSPVVTATRMSIPKLTTPSIAPFAAIQDPKRPATPALQDLSQEILDMGQSQQLRFIPKLIQSANHSDSMIRTYAAHAMGQIAAIHPVQADIETMIPVLGKLTQDSSLEVRSMATKALNQIRSPQGSPKVSS
jgi:hypothetical protein